MKLASPDYVKECRRIFDEYYSRRMTKKDFEDACYMLQTAAKQAERNALEPTEDELKYAAIT